MFRTATNERIGAHLSELIDRRFGSTRSFCRDLLKLECPEMPEPTKDEIDKKANKLSQIRQGKKGIQIDDLGYFCELLNVSCEEILSAKEHPASGEYRYSNYNMAFSDDERLWENYIHHDEKLILNSDEYNMTVIDYALKFKNYKMLKYLIEKGYIWFVKENHNNYTDTFGAGTKIERKPIYEKDVLNSHLHYIDALRTDMVALAIENGDFEMLTTLHARETPDLYNACEFAGFAIKYNENYNPRLIENVAAASREVVDYFTSEFSVTTKNGEMKCIFPYTGQLIDKMIEIKSPNTVYAIKNAIEHNKWARKTLSEMVTREFNNDRKDFSDSEALEVATQYLNISEDGSFLKYNHLSMDPEVKMKYMTFNTNIVCVKNSSQKQDIGKLVNKLNLIYSDIADPQRKRLLIK